MAGKPSQAASQREKIEAACEAQLVLNPGACACVAGRAEVELDDHQRHWLVLNVSGRRTEAHQMQADMSNSQLYGLKDFMSNVPDECND